MTHRIVQAQCDGITFRHPSGHIRRDESCFAGLASQLFAKNNQTGSKQLEFQPYHPIDLQGEHVDHMPCTWSKEVR